MRSLVTLALVLGVVSLAHAQLPEIATCRDGTTQNITQHRGACSGHRGVASYAPAATPPTPGPTAAAPPITASPTPAAVPSTTAPTGAPGQVWVNTASGVYHCPGDRWFGKTKRGQYLTEAAAKAAGDRPDHGKTCS